MTTKPHPNTGNKYAAKPVKADAIIQIRCQSDFKNRIASAAHIDSVSYAEWILDACKQKLEIGHQNASNKT